jgi:hypothetical protein
MHGVMRNADKTTGATPYGKRLLADGDETRVLTGTTARLCTAFMYFVQNKIYKLLFLIIYKTIPR